MSGGSFDYLYSKLENEPLDIGNLSLLRSMFELLESEGEVEASSTLKELYKEVEEKIDELDKFLNDKILPLQKVMKGAEWWFSCDSSQDVFQLEYVKFLLREGKYIPALRYYRRVKGLDKDREGFLKAKEELDQIRKELE